MKHRTILPLTVFIVSMLFLSRGLGVGQPSGQRESIMELGADLKTHPEAAKQVAEEILKIALSHEIEK